MAPEHDRANQIHDQSHERIFAAFEFQNVQLPPGFFFCIDCYEIATGKSYSELSKDFM